MPTKGIIRQQGMLCFALCRPSGKSQISCRVCADCCSFCYSVSMGKQWVSRGFSVLCDIFRNVMRQRCRLIVVRRHIKTGVGMGKSARRPHNECRSCGYTWYPRGKDLSLNCPRCHGAEIGITLWEKIKFIASIAFVLWILIYIIFLKK